MSETAATVALLTQPKQGQGEKHTYSTGNTPGARKVTAHPLDILLELKLNDFDLADELIKAARKGESWAITLCYARVAGLPVQRHEAKLMQQVDDTAALLAKAYGMTVEDVRAKARQIAQGT